MRRAPPNPERGGPAWRREALHGDDGVPDRTLPLLPDLDNPRPRNWAVTTAGMWKIVPFARPEEARAELATRVGLQLGPAPAEVTLASVFEEVTRAVAGGGPGDAVLVSLLIYPGTTAFLSGPTERWRGSWWLLTPKELLSWTPLTGRAASQAQSLIASWHLPIGAIGEVVLHEQVIVRTLPP